MKRIMTGLDHKRAGLGIREQFALTKEKMRQVLLTLKDTGMVGGCVILSTCNRTELYASILDDNDNMLTRLLCDALGKDFAEFGSCFAERADEQAMEHLCRVASGLDSQVIGDDQIITQVREALELSRGQNCTDSYVETMFKLAIQAAKEIKTKVILKTLGTDSVPKEALERLKSIFHLEGKRIVVIGNGKMGRLVSELFIQENAKVTVTLRKYKRATVRMPHGADAVAYEGRYQAIEKADIVVSATASPHLTLTYNELNELARLPEAIVDLAVPRDVEPSIQKFPGLIFLTLDDISKDGHALPPESVSMIERILSLHIEKYEHWEGHKEEMNASAEELRFFPLFIDLSLKKVLVIGGGNIAQRRIKLLLDFGADITLISPQATETLENMASHEIFSFHKHPYKVGDITAHNPFLVVVATNDRQVNHEAMKEAKSLNILVSVADCRKECSFFFPAIAEGDGLLAGLISKNGEHGSVRRMAKELRDLINE